MATLDNVNVVSHGDSHHYNNNNGGQTWDVNDIVSITKKYREGTGRRRKPLVPDMTPYVYKTLKQVSPTAVGDISGWGYIERSNGFLPYFNSNLHLGLQTPLEHDPNVSELALIDAMVSIDRRDLDLGTAWKERNKTASLVAELATATTKTIIAARKGRGREILDIWGLDHDGARGRGFVDAYLAYHYGVKPTLMELSGAAKALTRVPMGDWRVSASSKKGYETKRRTKVNLGMYYPYWNNSTLIQSSKVTIQATQIELSRVQDIAWSLGLDAPLSTAWEVTPFSFVLDWAIPIGDWLRALNTIKYFKDWVICTSAFRKETCTFDGAQGVLGGWLNCSTSVNGGVYEKVDVTRSISMGPPVPNLPIKDGRSVDHMAKALALLASIYAHGEIPKIVRY